MTRIQNKTTFMPIYLKSQIKWTLKKKNLFPKLSHEEMEKQSPKQLKTMYQTKI